MDDRVLLILLIIMDLIFMFGIWEGMKCPVI